VPDERPAPESTLRKYGSPPFSVAVVHGGPGARGELAPVARELASWRGVLEPLQTAVTLEGQVEELGRVLGESGDLPVTLIGFSWGAWLGLVLGAYHPALVKKLILVGCAGLGDGDGARTHETRIGRLGQKEAAEFISLIEALDAPGIGAVDVPYARLEELLLLTDAYRPLRPGPNESRSIDFSVDAFRNVWREAARWRESGRLLGLAKSVRCPVVAVHGAYDPHPAEGVRAPLSEAIEGFRFILLKQCGHTPWIEEKARETFFRVLNEELEG
jgi:pimeloyl-ACP methyl ester carboxylesterase